MTSESPATFHGEQELAAHGIRAITGTLERERLLALAEPMLEWRRTIGIPSFPFLRPSWIRERGWAAAVKVWVDAKGKDERAWCAAARLVSPATELVAAFPKPDASFTRVYRTPLSSVALEALLEPFSYSAGFLFPEDQGFALAKDDGYTLVLAGPPEFVRAAVPEGVEKAWAEFRAYAEGEFDEPGLSHVLRTANEYHALSVNLV